MKDPQKSVKPFDPWEDSIMDLGPAQIDSPIKKDQKILSEPSQIKKPSSLDSKRPAFKLASKEKIIIKRSVEPLQHLQSYQSLRPTAPNTTTALIENHEKFLGEMQQQWKIAPDKAKAFRQTGKLTKNVMSSVDLLEGTKMKLTQSKIFERTGLTLPKIDSTQQLLKMTDSQMRKSKTAQEAQREQQKQETVLTLPPLHVGSPSDKMTGFASSKQGKSFLQRKPQAKIVSRLFSSKSGKN